MGGDDVVERQAPLDRAEGKLLGQRAVAPLEAAGLAVQRAIGPWPSSWPSAPSSGA